MELEVEAYSVEVAQKQINEQRRIQITISMSIYRALVRETMICSNFGQGRIRDPEGIMR
jgi:hypothetical protein